MHLHCVVPSLNDLFQVFIVFNAQRKWKIFINSHLLLEFSSPPARPSLLSDIFACLLYDQKKEMIVIYNELMERAVDVCGRV
jgi:hypothetical protein